MMRIISRERNDFVRNRLKTNSRFFEKLGLNKINQRWSHEIEENREKNIDIDIYVYALEIVVNRNIK